MSHTKVDKPEKEPELTKELTDEEYSNYQERATQLAAQHNVSKVTPIVFIHPKTLKRSVCYLKEPNFDTKVRVMDKAMQIGLYSAANELRKDCVITDVSDAITYADSPECDEYKLGVVDSLMEHVNRLQDQFKKKSEKLK